MKQKLLNISVTLAFLAVVAVLVLFGEVEHPGREISKWIPRLGKPVPNDLREIDSAPTQRPGDPPGVDSPDSTPSTIRDNRQPQLPAPTSPNSEGDRMIRKSVAGLGQSPPLIVKARFRASFFGVDFGGPVEMLLQGQGSGKSRTTIQFAIDHSEHRLLHVIDGKRHYFQRESDGQKLLEFVNLADVSNAQADLQSPLQAGSLPALLHQVSVLFTFSKPQQQQVGSEVVWTLEGQWRLPALKALLGPEFEDRLSQANWQEHVPDQLPHRIRLRLSGNPQYEYFPYRVEFIRAQQDQNPLLDLEILSINQTEPMPDSLFTMNAPRIQPIDRTTFYVERFQRMRETGQRLR